VRLSKASGGSIISREEILKQKDILQSKRLNNLHQNLIKALEASEEEITISWQQKIFSKREYLKYTQDSFEPQTILDEHYKNECTKLKESNKPPTTRIFTFIDSDPFQFYDEINSELISAPKSLVPPYLQRTNVPRKRRPLVGKAKSIDVTIPHTNIVNYKPFFDESTSTSLSKSHNDQSKLVPYNTMYIMADFTNEQDPTKKEDAKKVKKKETNDNQRYCILCTIRMDANGAIIMKPDFSQSPYIAQTFGTSKETFEYYLEHASSQINAQDLIRENRLHKELYMRHSEYVKNLCGHVFKMPEQGVMKVHVFGEIISARNFDYDDLHVYYQLDLPNNWHPDPAVPISGFTQTSRTKVSGPGGSDEIAYFAHPFEFDLYYKNDDINPNYKDQVPKMPKIVFEVASYDSWSRYRTEGYTFTQIPTKPGIVTEDLACWRPRGDSIIYELRRFFIGGSPELEDISYVTIPSDHEVIFLLIFDVLSLRSFISGFI
jgi:Meckel syndrome type 1 protein